MIIEANGQKLEVPDGLSQDQIAEVVDTHSKAVQTPQAAAQAPSPEQGPGIGKTLFDKAMQVPFAGYTDEITDKIGSAIAEVGTTLEGTRNGQSSSDIYKAAQMMSKRAAEMESTNHPLASLAGTGLGIAATLPMGIARTVTGKVPAAYQGARGAINAIPEAVSALSNWARGGAFAEPAAGEAGLSAIQRAANLGVRSAKGTAVAAPGMAAYGAGTAEDGKRVDGAISGLKDAAIVGVGLPVAGAAAATLAKAVAPAVKESLREAAMLAEKHGIPLGLDQITNSKSRQYLAAKTARVPLSGGAKFADTQQEAFNAAIGKTIGLDGAKRITNDVYDEALTNIGQKFDDALSGKTLTAAPEHMQRLDGIVEDAKNTLTNDKVSAIQRQVDKIKSNFKDGAISGEKIGDLRSQLIRDGKKADPGIKDAINEMVDTVMDISADGHPEVKTALKEAKYQWKNAKTIEPLLAKSAEGNISPALLKNRVITNYGASQVARGKAGDLGELAKVGDLLKSKVGDSGTPEGIAAYKTLLAPGAALTGTGTAGAMAGGLPGAAASVGGAIAGAKGYQMYNASQSLVRRALKSPSEEQKLIERVNSARLKTQKEKAIRELNNYRARNSSNKEQ